MSRSPEDSLRRIARSRALEQARGARLAFPKSYEGRWSPTEMQVLQVLAERGAMSGSAIAADLAMDDTTVSKALGKFIEHTLVEDAPASERGPGQNRMRERSLTPEGEALAARHLDYVMKRITRFSERRAGDAASEMHSRYDG